MKKWQPDFLHFKTHLEISFAWPAPIFTQGHYRLQYKFPAQKGSGPVHRPDWN